MTLHSIPLAIEEPAPSMPDDSHQVDATAAAAAGPWESAAKHSAQAAAAGAAQGPRPILVAAHGGAGASTWAQILGGIDAGALVPTSPTGPVYLVARASAAGVSAAKAAVADYGHQLRLALIVPAAPGKPHKTIANELRILSGAIELVRLPWSPQLLTKRPSEVAADDLTPKVLARVLAELNTITEGDHS